MVSLTVQIIKGNKERYCFNPEAYTGIHTSQKCAKQSFYYYYYYYNDKKKKKKATNHYYKHTFLRRMD